LAARAAEPNDTKSAYPLWDGQESIKQYAKRVNLPTTRTLDLGGGVNLELVLIPAGKFIMGTPEPKPVDEEGFRKKIIVGQAVFAVGIGALLVMLGVVIIRAIRQRRRPQYSLARFLAMILAASVAVLGGMHWWFSTCTLAQAQAEYKAALARFRNSYDWEKPAHEVTLTTPFYMGKYEVTQEQYAQVMGTNPSQFKGADLPVETVSWDDAQEFCKAVAHFARLREGDPGQQQFGKMLYRLPTEAEWEFACRAGTTTTYYTGDAEADLGRAAWYSANSGGKTHPVGQKEPNAFGLFDMHGNVWEWCQDYWQDQYEPEAAVDPQGPPQGQRRVLRGGCWFYGPADCRSARRLGYCPGYRYPLYGFRVVVGCGLSRTP
jgi:formylglycine-generating enzyme required for sulfatase activity